MHPGASDGTFEQVTWKEFDVVVRFLAKSSSSVFHPQLVQSVKSSTQLTIALLGTGHSFAYFATQLALVSLGIRVLLLSPSNADVARDYLLEECNAVGVVVEEHLLYTVQRLGDAVVPLIPVPPIKSLS